MESPTRSESARKQISTQPTRKSEHLQSRSTPRQTEAPSQPLNSLPGESLPAHEPESSLGQSPARQAFQTPAHDRRKVSTSRTSPILTRLRSTSDRIVTRSRGRQLQARPHSGEPAIIAVPDMRASMPDRVREMQATLLWLFCSHCSPHTTVYWQCLTSILSMPTIAAIHLQPGLDYIPTGFNQQDKHCFHHHLLPAVMLVNFAAQHEIDQVGGCRPAAFCADPLPNTCFLSNDAGQSYSDFRSRHYKAWNNALSKFHPS